MRNSFAVGQLLHYHLGANDDDREGAPPDKLSIAFATADVTLTGWRLGRISDHLCEGNLLAARALSVRYANVEPSWPHVARITIDPVSKG